MKSLTTHLYENFKISKHTKIEKMYSTIVYRIGYVDKSKLNLGHSLYSNMLDYEIVKAENIEQAKQMFSHKYPNKHIVQISIERYEK